MKNRLTAKLAAVVIAVTGVVVATSLPAAAATEGSARVSCIACWGPLVK